MQIVAFLRYFGDGDCDQGSLLTEIVMEEIAGWVEYKGGVEEACGEDRCLWQETPFNFIRL